MRLVSTTLDDVLSLINCSHSYGFYDDVLMSAFAEITGFVTDDEIEECAQSFLTEEAKKRGYTKEDYKYSKEIITEWRDKYCKKE